MAFRLRVESSSATRESYSGAPRAAVRRERHHLALTLQPQQRTNWCWAAIAASIARYYGAPQWQQQDVANAVLGPNVEQDVCAQLDDALRAVGCFSHWTMGRPPLERIRHELDAERPVCVCLEWRGGGMHYVVIDGYDVERRELRLGDTLHGPSLQQYDEFPRAYRGRPALWRATLWTEPERSNS